MATQRDRLSRQMFSNGNLGFNKPLPVDQGVAPNVATAARAGLAPTQTATTPNPDTAASVEAANLRSLLQRGVRITRLQR
jgi:hypothetical protein